MLADVFASVANIAASLVRQLSLAGGMGEAARAAANTLVTQTNAFPPGTAVVQQGKALRSRRFWEGTVLGSMLPALRQVAAGVAARSRYDAAAARLSAAQALAALPCSNPLCTRLRGASEARLRRGRRCGGCGVARFCCEACRDAAWPAHAAVCTQLAAAAAAAAAPGGV